MTASELRALTEAPVKTTCPYCGVGCGVLATPGGKAVEIAGDPAHPANFGRLCVKGSALGETVGLEGRLLNPLLAETGIDGRESMRPASWDDALDTVARNFARIIHEHGSDAVAFYVSGQLLTEDYYVANKLMKGYIGSANIDTNSRLCMSSAVAGHKRAFGEDIVPVSYEDLERADLIILVGSNTAWCHPIIFQRIVAAKQRRPDLQIVVIDPRRTATCEQADLHLPVRSGSDVWLFNGLLAYLYEHGIVDTGFVAQHTRGADDAVAAAGRSTGSLAHVARNCGLSEERLRRFYALFARTERVVTAFSQGVNQSSSGTDKVNAIINCHLLTGRIGKPGMGPFSITGQPNAMGGREVGGLANQLAAHLELDQPEHRALVQEFWNSPRIAAKAGYKAVELFDAIRDGRAKAVWIMATNPVVSLPDADKVKAALQRCEFVVVSELMRDTDTTRFADVLLPATGWGERDGTVTNSERRISRQRPFLAPPGEARPDWWMIAEVGRRLGHGNAFGYRSAHEIFVEYARLTAYRNTAGIRGSGPGTQEKQTAAIPRLLNLAGLANLTLQEYDALEPVRWPILSPPHESRVPGPDSRLFRDWARLIPLMPRTPAHLPDDDYPLVLNTGRVRDQWHTMSRTGQSPKLATHIAEPYVEIHPQDALLWGVQTDRLARVSTRWGACVVRVKLSVDIPRRQIFIPIHWNGSNASDARVGALVNPAVDPISGEPEFKHTPARVEPFHVRWYGFVLTRRDLPLNRRGSALGARGSGTAKAPDETETAVRNGVPSDIGTQANFPLEPSPRIPSAESRVPVWWTRIQGARFVRYEIAGRASVDDWSAWTRGLLGIHDDADWLEASDQAEGLYRAAHIENDRVTACVFVSPRADDLPARAWLSNLFVQEHLDDLDRIALLVGQPATPAANAGPTICSCFGVGRNVITQAIHEHNCRSPEALGARLKCGTNCGSCIPELKTLIAMTVLESGAEKSLPRVSAASSPQPIPGPMAVSSPVDNEAHTPI
jgi:assimilatory nitrate reductase catalytic subunit